MIEMYGLSALPCGNPTFIWKGSDTYCPKLTEASLFDSQFTINLSSTGGTKKRNTRAIKLRYLY
jgi:hypothetical protein